MLPVPLMRDQGILDSFVDFDHEDYLTVEDLQRLRPYLSHVIENNRDLAHVQAQLEIVRNDEGRYGFSINCDNHSIPRNTFLKLLQTIARCFQEKISRKIRVERPHNEMGLSYLSEVMRFTREGRQINVKYVRLGDNHFDIAIEALAIIYPDVV